MSSGIFPRYLDAKAIEALKAYQYKSCGWTAVDYALNYWWNFVVEYLTPRGVAPNILTLIGFLCSIMAATIMFFFNGSLTEAMPQWAYFACVGLLFGYQTLDAIDGKQARRIGASSPLGQLFDHGCDTFTTVLVPLLAVSAVRAGWDIRTLLITTGIQAQLFLFCWWDLHFHVFPHCSGQLGCTEGQLLVMAICLTAGILGSDIFITPFYPALWVPLSAQKFIPAILNRSITLATVLATSIIGILCSTVTIDIISGVRQVKNRRAGLLQLLAFLSHLGCQFLFFFSPAYQAHPVIGFCLLTAASSTIALRMELSAVGKIAFSPILWPVYPLHLSSFILAFCPLSSLAQLGILLLLVCWFSVYLLDLVCTSIAEICSSLGIFCFSTALRESTSGRSKRSETPTLVELKARKSE